MLDNTVFLGSSTEELSDHRKAIHRLLSSIEGCKCIWSEDTGQINDVSKYKDSKDLITSCDLFVGIVGHFYGTPIEDLDNVSLPVAELHLAQETNREMLIFIASEDFLLPANLREEDGRWKDQRKFRSTLTNECIPFDSVDALVREVERAFNRWLRAKLEAEIDSFNKLLEADNSNYDSQTQSTLVTSQIIDSVYESTPMVANATLSDFLSKELFPRKLTKTQFERSIPMNPQDIVPFVPIIVEATKFLLSEVSKWVDDIRKKASATPSTPPPQMKLPISEDQLLDAQSDPQAIAKMVNESVTESDIYEIQSLLDQIKTYREVLGELEKQEAVAAGSELAKIRVQIRQNAKVVLTKVAQLEACLESVYKEAS